MVFTIKIYKVISVISFLIETGLWFFSFINNKIIKKGKNFEFWPVREATRN